VGREDRSRLDGSAQREGATTLVSLCSAQITNEMTGRCFLATFHPLIRTSRGRKAVQEYRLPPFIDGSCRREPDFESPFPSITAICRAGNFAPRLRVDDQVVYLTVKAACAPAARGVSALSVCPLTARLWACGSPRNMAKVGLQCVLSGCTLGRDHDGSG
jgi:hypothetical protein